MSEENKELPPDVVEKITEFREKGNEKYRSQDFEGAISEYTAGLNLYTESIPLLVNRALAEIKLHQYTNAIRDCTDALSVDRFFFPCLSLFFTFLFNN
jgi:tetratricopeptide (TPR) repeat protein